MKDAAKAFFILLLLTLSAVSLLWYPPKGFSTPPVIGSRTPLKPPSKTFTLPEETSTTPLPNVTLEGGVNTSEAYAPPRSNPLLAFIEMLQAIFNGIIRILGRGFGINQVVNESNEPKEPSPYGLIPLAVLIAAFTAVPIAALLMRRGEGIRVSHFRAVESVEGESRRVAGITSSEDVVVKVLNILAGKASKMLGKPPHAVTHRECRVAGNLIPSARKDINDLIRAYELYRFAEVEARDVVEKKAVELVKRLGV